MPVETVGGFTQHPLQPTSRIPFSLVEAGKLRSACPKFLAGMALDRIQIYQSDALAWDLNSELGGRFAPPIFCAGFQQAQRGSGANSSRSSYPNPGHRWCRPPASSYLVHPQLFDHSKSGNCLPLAEQFCDAFRESPLSLQTIYSSLPSNAPVSTQFPDLNSLLLKLARVATVSCN